jgi:putative ABC transport system permease protein
MGGAVGLGMVYASTFLASYVFGYDISLSFRNVFTGISVSLIIGIVAGIIPAWRASRMDPVEAIRQ